MSDVGVNPGGALGALEATTGITNPFLLAGMNSYRAQNTILKGGFLDNKRGTGLAARSRAKYRPFVGNSMSPVSLNPRQAAGQFVGGTNFRGKPTRLGQRKASGGKRRG